MVPVPQPSSTQPFPPHLKSHHPNPQTPWNFSEPLFKRVQNYTSDKSFKLCEVLTTDPDLQFILKYFEHQKPPGYSIKRVVSIHNPDQTTFFEAGLKNMERESNNPIFAPKGKNEDPITDRVRVLSRWESQASQFSPVEIKSLSSRGTDTCTKAKVLPLWHGSTKEVCQSICWSGFTSFGKHHYFDENATKGGTKSTDKGYFGAGIYFTNSAQYATMYSSGGHLLLVWVSMREPYPVVNDKTHPQKGSDMLKLEGRMHYQNYNAHFIPVVSIRPHDPKCIEYYPCYKDQQPAWDEFVVFEKAQALPRFWIELGTDFPKVVLSDLGTAGELIMLLLNLLSKAEIQEHSELMQKLQAKADQILDQAETTPLGVEDQRFLKLAKRLLPEGEKLNTATVNMLIRAGSTPPRSPLVAAPAKAPTPPAAADIKNPALPLSVASLAPTLPPVPAVASAVPKVFANPRLPTIAFGKELWAQYLGDVGDEPLLPPDIHQILQSPCPFFPGKKVEETHLLTLIPKTVNGKPLTLNSLEEFVKHPKQGQATKYRCYWNPIKEEYGTRPSLRSYWALMTRDVIPESRDKSYDTQKQLLASYSQKAHVSYEVPHILETAVSIFMEYLKTGQRLYSDNPWTYTRCQERVSKEFPVWLGFPDQPLIVGGFAAGGLGVDDYLNDYGSGGVGGLRKFNDQGITQDSKETATPNIPLEMKPVLHSTPPVNPPPAAASAKISSSSLPVAFLSPILPKLSLNSTLPAIAFGKELWAKYLGDIGKEPPLPSDIQQILQSPCPFFPGKKVEETHLLTLIPKTVNGKPLSLNSLEELVKHPKQGEATNYSHYWDKIKEQYGSQPLPRSYWVLMTRDVIPGSRNKNYEAQKQLLKSYCQKAHVPYEVPHLLETVVSIFMEYLKTGQRLYSNNPWTYTRCQERISTRLLVIGGFSLGGLNISDYGDDENRGVGGLRKF
ncbi:MAG: hypothetical protein JSS10_08680 [Verrucomicrobia bacterium]|nr:hypothetical protein [Verrucomicrobiota bacterium]